MIPSRASDAGPQYAPEHCGVRCQCEAEPTVTCVRCLVRACADHSVVCVECGEYFCANCDRIVDVTERGRCEGCELRIEEERSRPWPEVRMIA